MQTRQNIYSDKHFTIYKVVARPKADVLYICIRWYLCFSSPAYRSRDLIEITCLPQPLLNIWTKTQIQSLIGRAQSLHNGTLASGANEQEAIRDAENIMICVVCLSAIRC